MKEKYEYWVHNEFSFINYPLESKLYITISKVMLQKHLRID